MKNKLLISSVRKIWSSKRKFLSLLCLALLGVGFFAGIKATSPDMNYTLDKYLDDQQVYDIEIISTLGLTENDIDELKDLNVAQKIIGSTQKTLRIISLTEINKTILKEGRMPTKDNEIVVEQSLLKQNDLDIGDTLQINSKNLTNTSFKIVGIVESPLYFTSSRGTTNVGTGELNYYSYVSEKAFNTNYYTNIYMILNDTVNLMTDMAMK